MQIVYVTKGLPACGKSSLGERMAQGDKNLRLVAKDDIRKLLYRNAKWNQSKEPLVVQMRDTIIHELLGSGYNVYVHDTNLAGEHIERIKEIAAEYDVEVSIIDMTTVPVEECIKRDALRENSVGYRVILGMAERYLPEQYNTFRAMYPNNQSVLDMLYEQRNLKYDAELKDAIIVDIDGTLAIMGDRSPYDFAKVSVDKVFYPLVKVLDSLSQDYTILFLSGREATCFNETRQWLQDNNLWYFDSTLIMREANDNRSDNIVKEELYREYVQDFYNVVCIFDDRKQVVEMWRKLGLFCCQVNWGDF
jgi:predicted kinase